MDNLITNTFKIAVVFAMRMTVFFGSIYLVRLLFPNANIFHICMAVLVIIFFVGMVISAMMDYAA